MHWPMGEPVMPEWAISLAILNMPLNCNLTHITMKGKPVEEAREIIVEQALKMKAQYLFFVDSDTAPPYFAVRRLMNTLKQADEKVKIVGGIYCSKSDNSEPVVYKKNGAGCFWKWKQGEIFECDAIGTGCMLIDLSLFKDLPKPWFKTIDVQYDNLGINQQTGEKVSDDTYFCDKVLKAGYKILADGGVLPIHWDIGTGTGYILPRDSYPLKRDEHWYRVNPRENVDVSRSLLIDGWMNEDGLVWLAEQARQHLHIVEVGSHLGRSTVAMAAHTKGKVYAFDDWKGPRDIGLEKPGDFYAEFLENVKGLPVVPLRGDHSNAQLMLEAGEPDMVFIDGSHEYEDVKRDIMAWKTRMKKTGLLCGHDISYPGVKKAVDELLTGYAIVQDADIWHWKDFAEL